MIKKLQKVVCVLGLFVAKPIFAQLPLGSIAPNFTYNDINGQPQDLYTYLNQGKTVYLDISATWCGPCWNYHTGAVYGGNNILKFINVTSSVTAGVSSYTTAPAVVITGGGGSGATAEAVLTNGVVTSINITDHGTGYTSLPTIAVGTSWMASTAVNVGDQVYAGNNLYTVSTAGVTGTTAVTHTNGSAADGSAVLDYAGIAAKATAPTGSVGKEAALHELWRKHGPIGAPGVEGGTTNDVVVLFLEAQTTNTLAQLNGVDVDNTYAGDTKGNWVQGTTYPIIDLPNNTFNTNYKIGYFPTIYMICPNRTITEVGQKSYSTLLGNKDDCPPPASVANDPALLPFNVNLTGTCSSTPLIVQLQNNGTSPLTACNIEVKDGPTTIVNYPWSGNLLTYATQFVTLTTVSPTVNTIYNVLVTSGDGNGSNNTQSFSIEKAPLATKKDLLIEIATDRWGAETKWELWNSLGVKIGYGGPYAQQASNGTYPQLSFEKSNLPDDCYEFIITDTFGDGMTDGAGYYKIYLGGDLVIDGINFTGKKESKKFQVEYVDVTGINKLAQEEKLSISPNPASGSAKITFSSESVNAATINIVGILGNLVYAKQVEQTQLGLNTIDVNMSNISNGIYFVNVELNGKTTTQKIVVNN